MFEAVRDRAAMYIVYVAEAHPEDEWQLDSNREEGVVFRQPQVLAARVAIAEEMMAKLGLRIPTLVDAMDDAAVTAFAAWPERLFVVDSAGKVAFAGAPGPFGFDPQAARAALESLLAS